MLVHWYLTQHNLTSLGCKCFWMFLNRDPKLRVHWYLTQQNLTQNNSLNCSLPLHRCFSSLPGWGRCIYILFFILFRYQRFCSLLLTWKWNITGLNWFLLIKSSLTHPFPGLSSFNSSMQYNFFQIVPTAFHNSRQDSPTPHLLFLLFRKRRLFSSFLKKND